MHIIVLLIIGVVLLFNWLIGHWFARVLTFLGLIPVLGVLSWGILENSFAHQRNDPASVFCGFIIGIGLAWPVASIPAFVWRFKSARLPPNVRPDCSDRAHCSQTKLAAPPAEAHQLAAVGPGCC